MIICLFDFVAIKLFDSQRLSIDVWILILLFAIAWCFLICPIGPTFIQGELGIVNTYNPK